MLLYCITIIIIISFISNMEKTKVISRITQNRIMKEIELLQTKPNEFFDAVPEEGNIFNWYFLIRGPKEMHNQEGKLVPCPYADGFYIGNLILPIEYPFKPPDFIMLTPSGRYDIGLKICLSFTGFHPDEWDSTWNIPSMLSGFISNMLADEEQGKNMKVESFGNRVVYAKQSHPFNLQKYEAIYKKFTRFINPDGTLKSNQEIEANVKEFEELEKKKTLEKELKKKAKEEKKKLEEEKKKLEEEKK